MCNALTLYVYLASETLFLYGVLRVQVSTAVQPVHSTQHVHSSSPLTQHYSSLFLYRPPNTIITMHTLWQSRCTGLCIYACALRQTRHGHMRRGVLGAVCNALTLYVFFASRTPFLYGVQRVPASTAVQPVHSTHVHFSSQPTQHYSSLCLYRPPNTSIPMHTPLQSRCTRVCIYTCALRQTPHGHMRRFVLGFLCNAFTLYVYFASETPFLFGVRRVQASTAVQPVRTTHMHFSSPPSQHYPTLCLYRPPNTIIPMHSPLHSRCTGVYIYT